jgi:hypothetical protein
LSVWSLIWRFWMRSAWGDGIVCAATRWISGDFSRLTQNSKEETSTRDLLTSAAALFWFLRLSLMCGRLNVGGGNPPLIYFDLIRLRPIAPHSTPCFSKLLHFCALLLLQSGSDRKFLKVRLRF